MSVPFSIIILALALLGAIGMGVEIRFWRTQRRDLENLDSTMQTLQDPTDLGATFFALGLQKDHSLTPALERIFATESSPEEALGLVEMGKWYQRMFGAIRRYAIAVLLLCGIAGTLFSLRDALPSSGIFSAFNAEGQIDSVKYAEAFGKLQPELTNAFWPSICGILATLVLQAGRYGLLVPAQQAAARKFISVVCLWVIPWKLRHQEAATAATSAASKFEAAATSIFTAANMAADVIDAGVSASATSFSNLGKALLPVSERMNTAVECIEKAGNAMRVTVDQFDKNLAANGPFIRAIEQLYDAVSPAEERYERLLVNLGELQKLSTSQNVNLAQLHQKTVSLAEGVLQTAGEATRMADNMRVITAGFPSLSQSVKDHGSALTQIASEWKQAAAGLVSGFSSFCDSISKMEVSHRQIVERLLQDLPGSLAVAVSTRLPQELRPLFEEIAGSRQRIDGLQQAFASLEGSVNGLRDDLRSVALVKDSKSTKTPQVAFVPKKKRWWRRWPL